MYAGSTPDLIIRIKMDKNIFDLDIQECEYLFYQGDKLMLFEAVRRCAQYGISMPDWIRIELESGLTMYHKHEVKDFGDAFGISRGSGYHQNAEKKKSEKAFSVWKRVQSLHRDGCSIDNELFNLVGKEYAVSGSTARDYYALVKRVLNH